MKYSSFFFVLFFYSALIHAQSGNPIAGQKYRLTYYPLQTDKFQNAEKLTAVYAFNFWGRRTGTRLALRANVLKPDSARVNRIELTKEENVRVATIAIPQNAAVLSYYVTDGTTIDMNDDKTFVQYVFGDDGKPVQNASYFLVPFLKMSGATIEELIEEAKKEIIRYPQNFRAYYQYYQLRLDWKKGTTGIQTAIAAELADLEQVYSHNVDFLNLAARTYYSLFRDTKTGLEYRNRISPDKQYADVLIMYDRDAAQQRKEQVNRETSSIRAGLINKTAPNFQLEHVSTGKINLDQLRGKVVVILFWATWSKPSAEELASLQKMYQDFKGKSLEVLAINMDAKKDLVVQFLSKLKYSYQFLLADSDVGKNYGVAAIPQTVVIDRDGIIKKIMVGFSEAIEKDLRSVVASLLRGS